MIFVASWENLISGNSFRPAKELMKMSNNQTTIPSLGWALIGCGGAGNRHTQWAMSTPGVEIHGFCDKFADSAARFHQQYDAAYHTTNPERIFTDPSVDIVSIATPHDSHADLAVAACQAKKHLFFRKTDGNDHIRLSAYLSGDERS